MGPRLREDDGLEGAGKGGAILCATLKTVIPAQAGTHTMQKNDATRSLPPHQTSNQQNLAIYTLNLSIPNQNRICQS
jgi:hypothetical protein